MDTPNRAAGPQINIQLLDKSQQDENKQDNKQISDFENNFFNNNQDQQNEQEYNGIQQKSLKEMCKEMLPYGFLSYGGPMAHISMLQQTFIEKLKWVTPEQFTELFALCQSLPGPTSTQMIISIGSLVTQSARGGILAFLLFATPAALVLFIFAEIFRIMKNEDFEMPVYIGYALEGFQSAAVAIVAQAAWKLGNKYTEEPLQILLMFTSAIVYLLFPLPVVMVALMCLGGFFNLFLSKKKILKSDSKKNLKNGDKNEEESEDDSERVIRSGQGPFGKLSLIIFAILFVSLPLLAQFFTDIEPVQYAYRFFLMGSIIVGGGHVIIPLMLSEFSQFGISDKVFWNGFSIVAALPGPLFNLSIFVGTVIDGVRGGLIGWVMLFLPAFLMIWGILPFWDKYRTNPKIQKVLKGVGASSIGFIITAVYLLWDVAGKDDRTTTTLICIGSYVALHVYGCRAPFVVLSGGCLMVCRQVVLVQYRGLPAN